MSGLIGGNMGISVPGPSSSLSSSSGVDRLNPGSFLITYTLRIDPLKPSHHFTRYWLPVFFLCTAIFIQSAYPAPDRLPSFDFSDKLLHGLVYGVLSILIYRALNATRRWRGRNAWLFWVSFCAATLYGASDEWHQSFVVERHADAADLIADGVGALLGNVIYACLLIRRG